MSELPPPTGPPAPAPVWGEPAPSHPEGPIHPGSGREGWLKRGGGLVAMLVALGSKLKGVLLVLPKLKLLTTSGSMLVSIAAYTLIWPWTFSLGFVLMLLVHEMGHVVALRREGIKASAPMFIPFLGAVVAMKELPRNAAAEARVGLAGPIAGGLAALVPVVVWQITGEPFWQALAFVGFLLNLFNLLPVLPLDGGRAMAALAPWMWIVGFAGLAGLTVFWPNPIMFLILLVGGFETWKRWKSRHEPDQQRFLEISPRGRALVAVTYLALVALLAVGMGETHLVRDFTQI